MLTWRPPFYQPDHYRLYRVSGRNTNEQQFIEIEGNASSYFDENEIGECQYQLTAVYEYGESPFALTTNGETIVTIEITDIKESFDSKIISLLNVYNLKGQRINVEDLNELSTGIYFLQGWTEDGRLVSKKTLVP